MSFRVLIRQLSIGEKKLLTILANRRQEERFTDPVFTTAQEILAENGSYILTEHTPYAYIITE
jgi:hypothetical protein